MCKKEKYEKHRNVLVFFFAFAMLVDLNSQKLSLREPSILRGSFYMISVRKILRAMSNRMIPPATEAPPESPVPNLRPISTPPRQMGKVTAATVSAPKSAAVGV